MSLLNRTLLLAAVAIGGVALMAPLAARSAVEVPAEVADHLLTVADLPTLALADRGGALTAREGEALPATAESKAPEQLSSAAPESPPVAAMEATLVVVPRPAPAPVAPRAITYSGGSVWDDMAKCESGGNWAINTGNGYYGGLQFSHGTWHGYAGGEFAEYPHEATREQQIVVAERLRAARGYAPWPACRAKLGLP